jgi:iron complex outermembrane receptor protein
MMDKKVVELPVLVIVLWLFFCAPWPGAARADEKPAQMDEVVVTASRYPEETSRIPANVSVITEKDIKNSTALTIPELLSAQAGIQVTDVTGNRRNYYVDLRGFGDASGQNTLILVDGRRVTGADLSGTDWFQIPLDRVQKIEIVRGGSSSVLYGDNATGGVINIITKAGGPTRYGVETAAGSYKTFHPSAYAEGSTKDLSYALTGSYLTTNGYRLNSAIDSKDVGGTFHYVLNDRVRADLSTGYHKDNTGLPGALRESELAGRSRSDSVNPHDFLNTEDYYFKGGVEADFREEVLFKIDTSFRRRSFQSYSNFTGGNFLGETVLDNLQISPRLVFKNRLGERFDNKLIIGMDFLYADEKIQNDSLFFGSRSTAGFNLDKTGYGWYIHDEIAVLKDLTISGGYRLDRAVFTFTPGTPGKTVFSEHAFTSGVNYRFLKQSQIYFNYNRSFRYPVLDEQFSFFTNTVLALQPQRSDAYESGVKHQVTPNLAAGIHFFHIDTAGEIFYNPYTYGNENLDGKTRREGIELSLNWRALDRLSFFMAYTYLFTAVVDGGQFDGKRIPTVPRHKAAAGVLVSFTKDMSLNLAGIYTGGRPFSGDFQNRFSDQESCFVLNAKLQYRWSRFKAYLSVNNLLDRKYSEYGAIGTFPEEKAYYPSPELNALIGLAVDL